ncbi:MAG: cobaltochelatase subunit CobN [Prochlorococcus sp.]
MHRLASLPGATPAEDVALVEQPPAPVLLLSSAITDISTLASVLELDDQQIWHNEIRALPLAALEHPAQVDHYLASTAENAELIIVRLLGGRGHWSYGLEQLQLWQSRSGDRQLLVLAGTEDQNADLHGLGSCTLELAERLAALLREGGPNNMAALLRVVADLLDGREVDPGLITVEAMADPSPWDWRQDPGEKVGVILYRALARAGDLAFPASLNRSLRAKGLCPRALWVSSLRDPLVQQAVKHQLAREKVAAVLTTTSFASVQFDEAGLGAPLWDELNVPVLQVLSCGKSRDQWLASSRGLDPLDLSLQVVLPELDGRITTRPCAFREVREANSSLATAVQGLKSDPEGLAWVVDHVRAWIDLRQTAPRQRCVGLVLANYPCRDGRIANGVGLDTPTSTASILAWLQSSGHDLGTEPLPQGGKALMGRLLSSRTNDPESQTRPPLDHLPLELYQTWWSSVGDEARALIEQRWGSPDQAIDLEADGFPIHGISLGRIVVLIQPSRSYDADQLSDLHSPDLPPPHRYLAQYLWMRLVHGTQLLIHVGKHGSAEWLPGKGVGLSADCGPQLALGPVPHLYPFIVNDPGEGSQAKRRGHAVILDHLTPPLGRAGLHGPLLKLEALMDEYVEASQLGAERTDRLETQLIRQLEELNWPDLPPNPGDGSSSQKALVDCFDRAETYLCELKESQIRTGLHRLGQRPSPEAELELMAALARSPSPQHQGLTQAIAIRLGLSLDPWREEEGDSLEIADQAKLIDLGVHNPRRVGDAIPWLEDQAMAMLRLLLYPEAELQADGVELCQQLRQWLHTCPEDPLLVYLRRDLWIRLRSCGEQEQQSLLNGVEGGRLASGPSGAPTRGRPEVLPTGRNFYSIDLRGLPTEAAWDLGRRSAELLLDLHLLEQGEAMTHLALSVWGTATMRNGGEDIAQLFALIGVRPIWDGPTRRMIDLEVIPLDLLCRARVDVTLRISGLFRDAFPQLVGWVNQAQQLVAALDEPSELNPLAETTRCEGPQGRIYGSAPGAYGAGLQALIDSGNWEDRSDLGQAFLAWSQWRYDGSEEPTQDREGLERSLARVQVVLHNQDNREHDLLDSDDYYQFHGGLAAAVETVSGRRPDLWFGDHSRRERPRLHRLEKEIDKVMRSRLLNPRWLNGMKQHGYKGAFEMAASLDYLFAYDAATDRIPDWCYGALCDQWLMDEDIVAFIHEHNPWVLRDMAERLLEASNRGLWKGAEPSQISKLRSLVVETEAMIEKGSISY